MSTEKQIAGYLAQLELEEKSKATLEKYGRDLRSFTVFLAGRAIEKTLVLEYKASLAQRYAVASANSMLAAVNGLLKFMGRTDCCVRQFRVQRQAFCPPEKELTRAEYERLVHTAQRKSSRRLSLILQTICGTGIRVSELAFITAEAVHRGEAVITCKGKTRLVFIPGKLQRLLETYLRQQNITEGPVFTTRTGKPVSRHNIWREMKALCRTAQVAPGKVFPHNLRHLFARAFYGLEKDIAKLADILGHSSINTTRIYIVSTGSEHRRKLDCLHLIL